MDTSNSSIDDSGQNSRKFRSEMRRIDSTNKNIKDSIKANLSTTVIDIFSITKEIESFAMMPLKDYGASDDPNLVEAAKLEHLLFLFGSLKTLTDLLKSESKQMVKFERRQLEGRNTLE